MRYAFVSLSVVVIWLALIVIAAATTADVEVLATLATGLTLALFFIGFRRV